MRRSGAGALVCALVLAGCGSPQEVPLTAPASSYEAPVSSAPSPAPATTPGSGDVVSKLGERGAVLLERARADGATEVVLMISTTRGAAEGTASAVRDLGGEVQSSDVPLDFLRASVPTDRVEAVTALPEVSKVDLEEPATNWDPTP
ncbi:hypothetical protein [Umezawaea beigongshangensis]|uniref:hypothetical protein n=1 Tax=Umezawaea beigongshangensis TaxID=2780383 RepID=UPI0018F2617D|nr:hypothetical protein [Umezawaea beigongshangensis]